MGFNAFFPNSVTIDADGRIIHRGDLGIRAMATSPIGDPFTPRPGAGAGATSTPASISDLMNEANSIRRNRESVLGRV